MNRIIFHFKNLLVVFLISIFGFKAIGKTTVLLISKDVYYLHPSGDTISLFCKDSLPSGVHLISTSYPAYIACTNGNNHFYETYFNKSLLVDSLNNKLYSQPRLNIEKNLPIWLHDNRNQYFITAGSVRCDFNNSIKILQSDSRRSKGFHDKKYSFYLYNRNYLKDSIKNIHIVYMDVYEDEIGKSSLKVEQFAKINISTNAIVSKDEIECYLNIYEKNHPYKDGFQMKLENNLQIISDTIAIDNYFSYNSILGTFLKGLYLENNQYYFDAIEKYFLVMSTFQSEMSITNGTIPQQIFAIKNTTYHHRLFYYLFKNYI